MLHETLAHGKQRLVAAGLLGRSFANLRNANIGFEPAGAMTFHVSLPFREGYTTYADHAGFHARLTDELRALPGVTSVAAALRVPLNTIGGPASALQLQAGDGTERPAVPALGNMATAEYFRTIAIPLLRGRTFRAGDLKGSVAVILSEVKDLTFR